MDAIPLNPTENNKDAFANVFQQIVYLIDENESLFYVRTLDRPDFPARKINRLLLTAAILKQSGYLSSSSLEENETIGSIEDLNTSGSLSYFKTEEEFLVRNHTAFQSQWRRSQSGHWSYLVK